MATKIILTDFDFQSAARITGLQSPVSASDAATKGYVDGLIEGLAWKDNVRVATQGNISLAAPGTTIDGVTMVLNDRVLVRAQSTQTENGIYIWNGASTPMTRSADASTFDELENASVSVDEGTGSGGTTWRQSTVNGVLGTNNVVWNSFGTGAPAASDTTAGIIEIATQAEVNTGSANNLAVVPQTLAGWSGRALRFSQTFGDASATTFNINHNLNTLDVDVTIYETGGNQRMVDAEVRRVSVNQVQIITNTAPALNALRAVVTG